MSSSSPPPPLTTAVVPGDYPLRALFHTLMWPDKDEPSTWRCSFCKALGASMMCGCCGERACAKCFPGIVPTMQELAIEIGEEPQAVGFHQPLMVLVLCFACTKGGIKALRMVHPLKKPEEFVSIVRLGPRLPSSSAAAIAAAADETAALLAPAVSKS